MWGLCREFKVYVESWGVRVLWESMWGVLRYILIKKVNVGCIKYVGCIQQYMGC